MYCLIDGCILMALLDCQPVSCVMDQITCVWVDQHCARDARICVVDIVVRLCMAGYRAVIQ